MTESPPEEPRAAEPPFENPEGVRHSLAALRRDLPELFADRRNRGKWVCYHLDRRVAMHRDYLSLIRECNRLDDPSGESVIDRVDEFAGQEEIDYDNPPPKPA